MELFPGARLNENMSLVCLGSEVNPPDGDTAFGEGESTCT